MVHVFLNKTVFIRCLALAIRKDESCHFDLRLEAVSYLRDKWQLFGTFLQGRDQQAYTSLMASDSTYASDVEIRVVCAMLGVSVQVLTCPDMNSIKATTYNGSQGSEPVVLFAMAHGDFAYYDLVVSSAKEADDIERSYEAWRTTKIKQMQLENAQKVGYADSYGTTQLDNV